MADKKKDPTVSSDSADVSAPPTHQADDYAGNKKYADAPADLKPGPDSVVQVEVTEDDK